MKTPFFKSETILYYAPCPNCYIVTPERGKRDYFQVRLTFKQKRGQVDFTKDKHFGTLDECKKYIHDEFRKWVNRMNTYYRIRKPKY